MSYPQKSPEEALAAQAWLSERGLLLRETVVGLNRYRGAAVLANQSDMLVLETTSHTQPDPDVGAISEIYTYSRRTRDSRYACRRCSKVHTVGPRRAFATVQALKASGCPECGGDRFDRLAAGAATREEPDR